MPIAPLFFAFFALVCCKSAREPNEATEVQPAAIVAVEAKAASADGIVLKKVVGALSKEDPQAQHYTCTVAAADLPQIEEVKRWIDDIAQAPIVEALYFRAVIPSIQIFAYKDGQEILVLESYSSAKYRRPSKEGEVQNGIAEELIKLTNQKCPYP